MFGNRTESNTFFTVIDLDRWIIKHSTELDNRPFGTRTIGVSLASITDQFDWICGDRLPGHRSPCMLVFGFAFDVTKEKTCLFKQSKKQKRFVLNETNGVTMAYWFHCLVCRLYQANEHCRAFIATNE